MSLPSKKRITGWLEDKKSNALQNFEKTKKAEIYASFLGTEIEVKSQEWNECIGKMEVLYEEMQYKHKYFFDYCEEQYMNAMVYKAYMEKYNAEKEEIKAEFDKILDNISKIGSPKKILEYLKACGLEYPIQNESEEYDSVEIDMTKLTPWLQNQLSSGNSDEESA